MAKRAVKYAVIDAFTDAPFKGNPAAVCLLEDEFLGAVDEEWMQSVAKEFNISETAFLSRATSTADSDSNGVPNPRFNLRWFTPVAEVELCGHATLAAAHYLLSSGVVKCDVIEFVTKSGLLTAKKVPLSKKFSNNEAEGHFFIELDFPMVPVVECDSAEIPSIPETLNGAAMINVQKTATSNDIIVELASANEVAGIHPKFDELQNCAGRGVIITGAAPSQSGFDFFTRFFCPKLGVNEYSKPIWTYLGHPISSLGSQICSTPASPLSFSSSPSKMAKGAVKYAVIDTFTDTPFKGNPAAVCLLEDEFLGAVDEEWMQSVAKEFNISDTAFLSRASSTADLESSGVTNPRFNLRWFTPVAEVELCGPGALAAAHYLLTSGVVKCDVIEFVTKSGLLTAKKVPLSTKSSKKEAEGRFSIELDFPMVPVVACDSAEIPSIPETLNGAAMINVQKTATSNDIIVELASANEVAGIHPKFDELQNCAGRGVIITGAAPSQSGFDFFTRFFCPKLGVNEDPVCGSSHCALAPYWSKKLGKHNLLAYMASPRSGILDLKWEEGTQRVLIRGDAVTVMVGTLIV